MTPTSRFRDVCKRLGVVELPACALVDVSGCLVKAERIDSLVVGGACCAGVSMVTSKSFLLGAQRESQSGQDDGKVEAIRGLLQLTDTAHEPAVDGPWWTTIDVEHGGDRLSSDTEVVQMREQAAALFEGGELLAAAARFMQVLVLCPRCTKSNFNLAVILHMMGERIACLL
jgi:hypothetical protein